VDRVLDREWRLCYSPMVSHDCRAATKSSHVPLVIHPYSKTAQGEQRISATRVASDEGGWVVRQRASTGDVARLCNYPEHSVHSL